MGGADFLGLHQVEGVRQFHDGAEFTLPQGKGHLGQLTAQGRALDPSPIAALTALRTLGIHGGHFGKRRALLHFRHDLLHQPPGALGVAGRLGEHDHPQFDPVFHMELVAVVLVIPFNLVRGDNHVPRHVLGAQRFDHELITDPLPEFFQRQAFRLQGLGQLHPVAAEPSADFVLDYFIHEAFGQVMAGLGKIPEDQLPLQQLLQILVQHLGHLGAEPLGVVAELPVQERQSRGGGQVDFVIGDDGVMDDGFDAVDQFRACVRRTNCHQRRHHHPTPSRRFHLCAAHRSTLRSGVKHHAEVGFSGRQVIRAEDRFRRRRRADGEGKLPRQLHESTCCHAPSPA